MSVSGKLVERTIFNSLSNYFDGNKLLSANQSSICCNDSCMTYTVNCYRSWNINDANPALETRQISLDMSKAFDKVWHTGLIYK